MKANTTFSGKPLPLQEYSKDALDFINYVVLIWVNQTRGGDQTVKVPDCLIKARAKEAAFIVNSEQKFHINEWLVQFLYKLDVENALKPNRYLSFYPDVSIKDIIKAEQSKFFHQNENSSMADNPMNSVNSLKLTDVRSLNCMAEKMMLPDPSLETAIVPVTSNCEETDIYNGIRKQYQYRRKSFTKDEMVFIDHVVVIWLYQSRRGDQSVKMNDRLVMTRAREAACIINNECKFHCTQWLRAFKAKQSGSRLALNARRLDPYLNSYPHTSIYDIIEEEWWRFFGATGEEQANDTNSISSFGMDKPELKTMQTDDTIHSYNEALGCLSLLEKYALKIRNVDAVVLVTQIEEFLQKELCVA